ncbi:hypothetical protein ABIB26_000192 [Arthrobacter sp. UYEF20]
MSEVLLPDRQLQPRRLREMLALHRAGVLRFLGPGLQVTAEEETGRFVARSAGSSGAEGTGSGAGSTGSGVSVAATAYIEARLPAPSVERSANPLLRQLHRAGMGAAQQLLRADGLHSTGWLLVSDRHELINPVGELQPRLFGVGPGTSGWGAGAFARPGTNAAPFRENDALTRRILTILAGDHARRTTPGTAPETASQTAPGTAPGLTVLNLPMSDPRVRPLLAELATEYDTRYGHLLGRGAAAAELNRYPAGEFADPGGALLIVREGGESVAGGAFRRRGPQTAEFKRIRKALARWPSPRICGRLRAKVQRRTAFSGPPRLRGGELPGSNQCGKDPRLPSATSRRRQGCP